MLYGTGRLIVEGADLCPVKFSIEVHKSATGELAASGMLHGPQYCLNHAIVARRVQVRIKAGVFRVDLTAMRMPRRASFTASWPPAPE